MLKFGTLNAIRVENQLGVNVLLEMAEIFAVIHPDSPDTHNSFIKAARSLTSVERVSYKSNMFCVFFMVHLYFNNSILQIVNSVPQALLVPNIGQVLAIVVDEAYRGLVPVKLTAMRAEEEANAVADADAAWEANN